MSVLVNVSKTVGRVANSVDPDHTPLAASDLSLHCLFRPICPNTWVSTIFPNAWS